MPLTVERLCSMTKPALIPIAGLEGLKNRINWVIASDNPEPRRWLRGGEFNLISGWNLNDDAAMIRYMDQLYSSGVAGIGFGIGLKFSKIPAIMIERANALKLPLCEVPYELSFAHITQIAAEQLVDKPSQLGNTSYYSQILDDAIDEKLHLSDITMRLANSLLADCQIIEQDKNILAEAVRSKGAKAKEAINQHNDFTSFSCTNTIELRIKRKSQDFSLTDKAFIHEMILAARIIINRTNAVNRAESRLKIDIFSMLMQSFLPLQEIRHKLFSLGFDPDSNFGFAFVKPLNGHLKKTADLIATNLPKDSIIQIYNNEIIVFFAISSRLSPKQLLAPLLIICPNCSIGVSKPVKADQLHTGLRQAQMLAQNSTAGLYDSDDMAIETMLGLLDPISAKAFKNAILHKDLSAELLTTIEMLLDSGFNLHETAQKLNVHRHTIRNRMERFNDLTGLDIQNADNRNKIWLALKIAKIFSV
ncbi:PucR family transcriptional regulator [Bartonella sp. HY406]|uniref:PucR family transcriptional regulator n=1 Tax=Bartonella sp. HY406 TaxID=2979331 RepID=UPI0021C731DA|nr:PucR family transcriptional regulator [Bartonella sp. HY406]UXN04488.1 PucR family transcriptional regulator [Bartonella sp. HY406]